MSHMHPIRRATARRALRQRAGFTLIELMVVVGLLVLIASMTVAAINVNTNNDKVRAGSRQLQSYLAGARDRAIYSKAPRGVRFLLTPTNSPSESSRTVSSMVFIAPTDPWTQGTIQLERLDANNDGTVDNYVNSPPNNPPTVIVRGYDNDPNHPYAPQTEWASLYYQGLLSDGARIQIPANNGNWYTITNTKQLESASLPGFSGTYVPPRLELTSDYSGPRGGMTDGSSVAAFNQGSGPQTYLLELPPSVLPNQDPVLMPKGAVIHLDRCSNSFEPATASGRGNKLPDFWRHSPSTTLPVDPSGFDYTSRMDVLFSPRGVVVGQAAQRGIIHFYIADQKDADQDKLDWASSTASAPEFGPRSIDGYERGDKVLLSLFTRTGAISTHHVHPTDTFKYAETGEVAGK